MARSTCGICGNHDFEQQEYVRPDVKLTLVQCADCGTVVGVDFNSDQHHEWLSLIGRVEKIEQMLKELKDV